MEDTSDAQPLVASPTAERSGDSTVVPPPSSSSAQGATETERNGNGEGERERESGSGGGDQLEERDGGNGSGGGGDPATQATVAGGDDGEGGGSGDGREREADVGGSSGLGSGDGASVPARVEEWREELVEERVEVQDVDSDSGSDETAEGARWRIEPRASQRSSEEDKGKATAIGGESSSRGQSSRPTVQGPVGISRGDYLEHAPPEVVMAAAVDAPGILDAAREAVAESRERGSDATGGRH